MPGKYHIATTPVPPRLPRVGKYGVVDWREDCARCHNCVKKACVYDRHREESDYIRGLEEVNALFFHCMGCLSCIQNCTKGLLQLTVNPAYERLGNRYWTPDIIHTTWLQAETAAVPVSGAGYRGKFAGPGFDAIWTDMSEIVRPTRDGIHGREYISTAVDIGSNPAFLSFGSGPAVTSPLVISLPLPLIIDIPTAGYNLPQLLPFIVETVRLTELIAIVDSASWPILSRTVSPPEMAKLLPHISFFLNPAATAPPDEVLGQTRLVEVSANHDPVTVARELKQRFPELVVSARIELNGDGVARALALADAGMEVLHVVADLNGDEIEAPAPRFIAAMLREIHTELIQRGHRDQVTLVAGGGIALAEHMAKAVICGADLTSTHLPLLLALECGMCARCLPGRDCPARLDTVSREYAVGRMRNLIAAWHLQLIELMGAMGMRDARRLRGDVGRAMFFDDLEEEVFGAIFGTRKRA